LIVLGMDTSGAVASAAVVRDGVTLSVKSDDTPFGQARVLESLVAAALDEAGTSLDELDGVAASRGPGSFTGSRLALAAARAYKVALGKPVVGVTSLEALALPLSAPGLRVVTAVDARRGEVYAAAYEHGPTPVEIAPPRCCRPEELASLAGGGRALFAGDGALRYREALPAGATVASPDACVVSAASVALIGASRLREHPRGQTWEKLVPLYLRRSDAELKLDREPPEG